MNNTKMNKLVPTTENSFSRNELFTQAVHQARFKMADGSKNSSINLNTNNEKDHLKGFIKKKFHSIDCRFFVEKPKETSNKLIKCLCGELKSEHKKDKSPYNKVDPWSIHSCFETVPTQSFGKIEFIGEDVTNTKLTEFVRLSYEDNLDDVIRLMFEHWNIEIGTLCISVLGGMKNFKMRKKEKNILCQGLIKAVKTTNALVLTFGLNLGITRFVGDAIQNGQCDLYDKSKGNNSLCCLGIAPWGFVKNKKILERSKGAIIQYKVSNEIQLTDPVSLNKNHTHYLFVDEYERFDYSNSKTSDFRAALEKKLSQKTKNKEPIPVVLLIIEGGYDVFIEASKRIKENVPIVICVGTGRASDLLGEAFREMQKHPIKQLRPDGIPMLPERFRNILKKKLIDKIVSNSDKVNEVLNCIEEIIHREYLITLFDMKEDHDLELAILYSLIKRMDFTSDSKLNTLSSQLSLCLKWNRVDIAKDKIFSGVVSLSKEDWASFLKESIINGKYEFIELFLQNGAVMNDFLTTTTLKELYEDCPRTLNFNKTIFHFLGRKFSNGLEDVKDLLTKIFGRYENPCTMCDEEIIHPFQELFIWSVLMENHECANYFWEKTEESLCLALVATKIYKCLMEMSPLDTSRIETLSSWKDYFENLAIKLLEECHDADQETAAYIIEKENITWGGYTCLEIAYNSENQKFISCMVCQNSLDFTWRAGFNIDLFQCVLCIFVPFLIYRRSFDNSYVIPESKQKDDTTNKGYFTSNDNWMLKLAQFYLSPQTKFCIHSLAFLASVIYFSYVVLFGMKRMQMTIHEILFIIYLTCMNIEKIVEMFQYKANKIGDRMKYWWNFNHWNKVDMILVILSIMAMVLRFPVLLNNWNGDIVQIYKWSKTIYSLIVGYFYLRFLRLISVHKNLGPKIVMISKMLYQLVFYIFIMLIILLSYGITMQGAYYPQRDFNINTLPNIVDYPYWAIFGEIALTQLVYLPWCDEKTNYNISNDCPEMNYFVPALTALYVFIAAILLLNILTAVFNYIFQKIHRNSIEIWKFTMFSLVKEYYTKPLFPLPFSIIAYAFDIFFLMCPNQCDKTEENEKNLDTLSRDSQITCSPPKKLKSFNFGKLAMPLESEIDKLVKYFENNSQKCVVKELVEEKEQLIESGMSRLESRLKAMSTIIKSIDSKFEESENPRNHNTEEMDNCYYPSLDISEIEIENPTFIEEDIIKTNKEIVSMIKDLRTGKLSSSDLYNIPLLNSSTSDVEPNLLIPTIIVDEYCDNNLSDPNFSLSENKLNNWVTELIKIDSETVLEVQNLQRKLVEFQDQVVGSFTKIESFLKSLKNDFN